MWDRDAIATGDPEAVAAVREAERVFSHAKSRGAQAFRVTTGEPAKRLERFDSRAEQILVIPQMAGG